MITFPKHILPIFLGLVILIPDSFSQLRLGLETDASIIKNHQIKSIKVKYYSEDTTSFNHGRLIGVREYDKNGNLLLKKDYTMFDGSFWTNRYFKYENNRLAVETEEYSDLPIKYKVYKYFTESGLLKAIEDYKDSISGKPQIVERFEYKGKALIKYEHDLLATNTGCFYSDRKEFLSYNDKGQLIEKKIAYNNDCYVLKHTFQYDSLGNCIKKYRKDDDRIDNSYEYAWNSQGLLISETEKSWRSVKTIYQYNPNQKVKSAKVFFNRQYSHEIISEYNSKGLIKQKTWKDFFSDEVYCIIEYSFYD